MTSQERAELNQAAMNGTIPDEKNPVFLFQMTHTELLVAIANGTLNPVAMAKHELADRGLDLTGTWVGFKKAAESLGL